MLFIKAFDGNCLMFLEQLKNGIRANGLFVKDDFHKMVDTVIFLKEWGLRKVGGLAGNCTPWSAMAMTPVIDLSLVLGLNE